MDLIKNFNIIPLNLFQNKFFITRILLLKFFIFYNFFMLLNMSEELFNIEPIPKPFFSYP
jgi:hypothetical protein